MAPLEASLSSLPDEVTSDILGRLEDPHSLVSTCRSLQAPARDIRTQAHWWHQHQRETSLLRLFRWRWMQRAGLTLDEVDTLFTSILTKRLEVKDSNWHGVFALMRVAVILYLPKTFGILLNKNCVPDLMTHERVLIADMVALDRRGMLEQLQQHVQILGDGGGSCSSPLGRDLWWRDMKSLSEWCAVTPVNVLVQLSKAVAVIDAFVAADSIAQDTMEVSDWELETASDSSDSESDEEGGFGNSLKFHMKESMEGLIKFTKDVASLSMAKSVVTSGVTQEGAARHLNGVAMSRLADSVLAACAAEMPMDVVGNQLQLIGSLKGDSTWINRLMSMVREAVVEEGLNSQALDALDWALSVEGYEGCCKYLQALRTPHAKDWPTEWHTGILVPSIVEEADASQLHELAKGFHAGDAIGLALHEVKGPLYPTLVAALEGGMWLGADPASDDTVDVYLYELAARHVRAALLSGLNLDDDGHEEEPTLEEQGRPLWDVQGNLQRMSL